MNKTVVILLAFAVMLGLGVSNAFALPYLSGNLGLVFVEDADIDDGFDTGTITFENGAGISVAIGNDSGYGSRVELELAYRANDFDTWTIDGAGTFDVPGDVTSLSLMGNGYIDFNSNSTFTPFIGAGIGFSNVEATIEGFGSEDDTVFAYQLALGGSFSTYTNLNFDIQYRYFGTSDPNFAGLEAEYQTHNIMVGLRSTF